MTRYEVLEILEHNWTCLKNHAYTDNELDEALEYIINTLEVVGNTDKLAIQALEYDDTKYHEEHGEVIVDKDVWEDTKRALEQEPKTGHWIPIYQGDKIINYRCSECELGDTNGSTNLYGWNYCRRCGARMVGDENGR